MARPLELPRDSEPRLEVPPAFAPYLPAALPDVNVPAYILDRQGIIRMCYQEPTYRTRPNLDAVLHDIEAAGL